MDAHSAHSRKTVQHAHDMIDRLPLDQVEAMVGLLETMLAEGRVQMSAPYEDEACSEEETLAAAASKQWLQRNQPLRNEDALAAFGLSPAEFERMGRAALIQPRDGR